MIPAHELISRIRWDEKFRDGHFVVGYLDHVEGRILRVPFKRIAFEKENRFSFSFEDDEGLTRSIPYHRIKEISKDGVVIWSRPA